MKKSLLLAAAALMMSASVSAQMIQIIKNGEVAAEYPVDESTSVVFVPAQAQGLAQEVAGVYDCYRQVTMPTMPQMGVVVSDQAQVLVEADGVNTVSVTLPQCVYVQGGHEMPIPAITISSVEVTKEGDQYSMTVTQYKGQAQGREFTVDFSALIAGDGEFSFSETLVFGSMPMPLQMDYSSQAPSVSPAEAVAGVYNCNREVYIQQMLEMMGVLVKDQAPIKITSVGEATVSITVPPCSYVMEGRQMDMPGATIPEVKVEVGESGYTMAIDQYQGLDEVSQRTYTIDFYGIIGFDGSYSFQEAMRYGSMPFTLTMEYTPEAEWIDLGMATYTDFFLSGLFGIVPAVTYEVPVQEKWDQPGVYRLVNAYGAACPLNKEGEYDPEAIHYLVINCEDPDGVYIEKQELGNYWAGYGALSGLSYGAYYLMGGKTLEEAKAANLCGTFKDGVIAFGPQLLLTSLPEYNPTGLFFGNAQEVTCILPGYSNYASSARANRINGKNITPQFNKQLKSELQPINTLK